MTVSPPWPPAETTWKHEDHFVDGLRLHVVRAGEGRPVVLLHGFPDFWFSWRCQIDALAGAGLAVVAPDMRGYNTSEKPHGIGSYSIDALVGDVVALIDRIGDGRAFLAGHDWGGIVAWYTAMRHPQKVEKLVILNAPHPAAFARDFWRTDQWLRSWYMFVFQLPLLPETAIRAFRLRMLEEVLRREILRPEAIGRDEIERYKEAFARPGALTSAIHYYRAAMRHALLARTSDVRPIEVPTLLLWGDRDPHLRSSLTEGLELWVKDLTVRRFPEAGHWVHVDEPDKVNGEMISFLATATDRAT